MLREGIIGNFFVLGDFLSKESRDFEFLIHILQFDICEDNSSIRSLIFIEFPDFAIRMTVLIADLHDI